jgi:hypothetical protein
VGGEWTERDAFGSSIHLLNNLAQLIVLEADLAGQRGATEAELEVLDAGFAALTSAVNHLHARMRALPRDTFGRGAAC